MRIVTKLPRMEYSEKDMKRCAARALGNVILEQFKEALWKSRKTGLETERKCMLETDKCQSSEGIQAGLQMDMKYQVHRKEHTYLTRGKSIIKKITRCLQS